MMRTCVYWGGRCVNVEADSMTIHDDTLFVYSGDELVRMFKSDDVRAAYKTTSKEQS